MVDLFFLFFRICFFFILILSLLQCLTHGTMTSTESSTTVIKPPNIICGGFIDVHGIWNNGFGCPIENLIQYFCCGTDNYHYCCSPDRYLSEINSSIDQIYISGQYQSLDHVIIDQSNRNALIKHSNIINKQFEQFRKYFLPTFLLTSSILFLIGIAIWFWLYKHKAFYAIERDDFDEQSSVTREKKRKLQLISNDFITKKRESINLTMDRQSRRISHPSTEV